MKKAMYFLEQKDMPTHWYNILPDLPEPLPAVLHPGTGNPVTPNVTEVFQWIEKTI